MQEHVKGRLVGEAASAAPTQPEVLKAVDKRTAVKFGSVNATVSGSRRRAERKGIVRVRDGADQIVYSYTVDTRMQT
jgi:hypothetical protein